MISVIKIGGNIIDNPEKLTEFLKEFASLEGPKILVHGGGKEATALASTLGIETQMVNGRRVTDSETLKVVTMVYAGLINKRIVACLQSLGLNAIGLSGADGNAIQSVRRKAKPIDYGFVGDVSKVNAELIKSFLNQGLTPVFCALTCSAQGQLLNTNADTIASSVATAMSRIEPTTLYYRFEKRGVLDAQDEVISKITPEKFEQLKTDGIVHSGMIPKIENALQACRLGVETVYIGQTAVSL